MEDYYEILGVSREGSTEEISKAYRDLLRKWNPNSPDNRARKKEANAMMMKINKANDVLKNPAQRDAYDQHHQQQHHEDDHEAEEEEEEPEIFRFKSRNADEMFKKFFPSAAAATI